MKKPRPLTTATVAQTHRALQEDLRKLEEEVQPDSAGGLAELRTRLGETYAHICEHFRLEEQDGYMDEVRKREPRMERIVQELGEEHRELMHTLDLLCGEARVASGVNEAYRGKVRKWIQQIRRHETRENEVVQDAFGWDLAAED